MNGWTRTSRLFAASAGLGLLLVAQTAVADGLALSTGYPQHPLSKSLDDHISRDDCAQPLEKWQLAFAVPSVTYTDLFVYAVGGSASCADAAARSGPTATCHRVTSFARSAVTSGQVVSVPSAAMLHALVDRVDVDPASPLDRGAICYPRADEQPADFTLSFLLFDGASAVVDPTTGLPLEATTRFHFDRRGPDAPIDVAVVPAPQSADVSFSLHPPPGDARNVAAYCFPVFDADAGSCAVPADLLGPQNLLGLAVSGNVCATAALTATSMHATGLAPGGTYALSLVVVDGYGNSGPISPPQCVTIVEKPEVLEDTAPSEAPPPVTSCSCHVVGDVTSSGPESHFLALFGLLTPLSIVARRALRRGPRETGLPQRRRTRTV